MRMPRRTLAAVSAAAVLSTVAVAPTAVAAPADDAARGGVVTSIIDALFGTDDADDAATTDPADPVAAATPAASVPITASPTPQPGTRPVPLAAGAGDPAPSAEQCSDLRGDDDEVLRCSFFSPSMGRDIDVDVLAAASPGAPVVYALDGMFTFGNENGWLRAGSGQLQDVHDGRVTIVAPVAPSGSFYADWQGLQAGQTAKWETFLTRELPGQLAERFGADTSRMGVMGMSMGGYAAAMLASRNPEMFDAVYSLSGFYNLDDPVQRRIIDLGPLETGANAGTEMWGPFLSNIATWRAHSPAANAANLTMPVRLTAANGARSLDAPSENAIDAWIKGAPMETASAAMTRQFHRSLVVAGNGGNVDLVISPLGAHEWSTWRADVRGGGWDWMMSNLGV